MSPPRHPELPGTSILTGPGSIRCSLLLLFLPHLLPVKFYCLI
jgi:hypothetical protein